MKTESLHPVELLALVAMALVWALATIARTLLLPLLAMLIALVRHHRLERPAPPATRATLTSSSSVPSGTEMPPATTPLAPFGLADLAEQLVQLPAAEVRALAGIRRKCSRAEAVAVLLAMPI